LVNKDRVYLAWDCSSASSDIADVSREQVCFSCCFLTVKTKMWLVAKMSYKSLEMNEFTDSECLPNFELEFDFLKRLRKPYRDIGFSREI